jgi:hypothetical protein
VDDEESGTQVRDWTALGAASAISWSTNADDNDILDASKPSEVKVVTFEATYGATDLLTAQYRYRVKNLRFYP